MSLEINKLVKSYNGRTVVDNVSFKVDSGKVYGILGRNGAGKTTTIKMILNIIDKDSGEILIDGKPLDVMKVNVGYLAEERSLYLKSTVKEQLIYFAKLSGFNSKLAKQNVKYWLERFEIENLKDKVLNTLSKGNQQKVQIISTIINNPKIVVFDEPFSGLDPVNSEIFKNVVLELMKRGTYILFSTHQMFYVEEFCERISILKGGIQCIEGNLLDIKKSYGRNKLILEIDGKLPDLNIYGIKNIVRNFSIYEIDILNEHIADVILRILVENRVKILNFNLKYRSLHEIFLEIVGD